MTSAHKEVYGEKKNNGTKGSALMKRVDIQHRINDLNAEFDKRVAVNADWIRGQLVDEIVNNKGDKMKAIDVLNKMNGNYEKDNEQKQGNVTLEMKF